MPPGEISDNSSPNDGTSGINLPEDSGSSSRTPDVRGSMDNPQDDSYSIHSDSCMCCHRRRFWTATHGFFGTMGGFALDISDNDPTFLPLSKGRTRVTLLPDALEYLAQYRPDLIPDISADYIRDKSKANQLAKALVCVQAFYFCLHLASRLCFGLGVTLIEMNTFAHAICALAVYVIWWNKPLDIDEPVLIRVQDSDDHAASIFAAMFLSSTIGRLAPLKVKNELPEFEPMRPRWGRTTEAVLEARPLLENSETHYNEEWTHDDYTLIPPDPSSYLLRSIGWYGTFLGFKLVGMNLCIESIGFKTSLVGSRQILEEDFDLIISKELLMLRRLASETDHGRDVLELSAQRRVTRHYCEDDGPRLPLPDWVADRVENASRHMGKIGAPFLRLIMAASAIYGGWHLLAWNGPFPNSSQLLLWRVSGLGVGINLWLIWLLPEEDIVYYLHIIAPPGILRKYPLPLLTTPLSEISERKPRS